MYVTTELRNNTCAESEDLLRDHFPNIDKRLNRAAKQLTKLLKEIKTVFPEACYYTASGGLHVVLGLTHGDGLDSTDTRPNQNLTAWSDTSGLSIGDGDW